MASGFIILKDGRCAAPRYTLYDLILQSVAVYLPDSEFKNYVIAQTAAEDEEENDSGFGFFRKNSDEFVKRKFDLRELTEENQTRFWKAARLAFENEKEHETLSAWLEKMLEMNRLAELGDDPDNLSDWQKGYVEPATGEKKGPGWD